MHLFDTLRKTMIIAMNNSAYDYLLDLKLDNGVVMRISQQELQDRIRMGRYVQLG